MDVSINYWAVLLAAASTMVGGSIWYSPRVFGNTWMRLVGMEKDKAGEGATKAIAVTIFVSLITAYVLAHVSYLSHSFFANSFLQDSLTTAFWMWLGFTASRFITHDAFERRPRTLTLMNVTHELVTFLVMGLIIGLMGF